MNHHGVHDDYSEVGCITAMTFDGDVLWQSGTPDPAKYALTNDVGFQVHDIDGDGSAEVIYCRDFELVHRRRPHGQGPQQGARRPRASRPPRATRASSATASSSATSAARAARRTSSSRTATGTSGCSTSTFEPLWSGDCRTGHYPFAFDVDGDGRDEIAIGYSLWDHDGRMLWNLEDQIQDHADGVAIVDFHEKRGSQPKVLYTASDSGFLHGEPRRPHPQASPRRPRAEPGHREAAPEPPRAAGRLHQLLGQPGDPALLGRRGRHARRRSSR